MRANLRAIAATANHDPRDALMRAAGPLTDYEVFHDLILVATYIRPPMMMKDVKGNDVEFHYTDRALEEDRFQGKIGLVLKVGPTAFTDGAGKWYGGVTVEPGDWVMYRPSDGIELFIKDHTGKANDGLPCRLFSDTSILGRVTGPALIY